MDRHGYALQLTQYYERAWRAEERSREVRINLRAILRLGARGLPMHLLILRPGWRTTPAPMTTFSMAPGRSKSVWKVCWTCLMPWASFFSIVMVPAVHACLGRIFPLPRTMSLVHSRIVRAIIRSP